MHHCHKEATLTGINTQLLYEAKVHLHRFNFFLSLSLTGLCSVSKTFALSVRLKIPQNTSVSFIKVLVNNRKTVNWCWSVHGHNSFFTRITEIEERCLYGFWQSEMSSLYLYYNCLTLKLSHAVIAVVFVWWEGKKLSILVLNWKSLAFTMSAGNERSASQLGLTQFIPHWADNVCKFLIGSGCNAFDHTACYVVARVENLFKRTAGGTWGDRYDTEFLSADNQTAVGVNISSQLFSSGRDSTVSLY